MRRIFSTGIIMLIALVSFSQGTVLTKDETVIYLNKKFREIEGHYRTPSGSNERKYFKQATIDYRNDLLNIYTQRTNIASGERTCRYAEYDNSYKFNPAHITEIILSNDGGTDPVGLIKIVFVSNVAKEIRAASGYSVHYTNGNCDNWKETDHGEYTVKSIEIPFLKGDPTNFNKLKKAFEHLRDLCKAEDDPFGE